RGDGGDATAVEDGALGRTGGPGCEHDRHRAVGVVGQVGGHAARGAQFVHRRGVVEHQVGGGDVVQLGLLGRGQPRVHAGGDETGLGGAEVGDDVLGAGGQAQAEHRAG